MCITRVSSNFFPCDRQLTSMVATCAVITAVVSMVLLGVAIYMEWGLPAILSLSAASGCSALVSLAIVCCKLASLGGRRSRPGNKLPLPSEIDPSKGSVEGVAQGERSYRTVGQELYALVKRGDLATYKKALELYSATELDTLCFNYETIKVDEDDSTTSLPLSDLKYGYGLLQIILRLQNTESKILFLRATLEKLDDHTAREHGEIYITEFLKFEDAKLLALILKKLDKQTIKAIMEKALDPAEENSAELVDAFCALYEADKTVKACFGRGELMKIIVNSRLATHYKIDKLDYFAKQANFILEKMEIDWWLDLRKLSYQSESVTCSVLHMAIEAEDSDLVRKLASRKGLVERPIIAFVDCSISSLLQAVLIGNKEIVEILLEFKARANPNFLLKNPRNYMAGFPERRSGCTQITPLMVAARLGRKEIYDALIAAGADPSITDNPQDPKAWRAEDYAKAYEAEAK